MKLLFVTNLYPPYVEDGYEILCGPFREKLEGLGHEIVVLASDYGLRFENDLATFRHIDGAHRALRLYMEATPPRPFKKQRRQRYLTGRYNYLKTARFIERQKPDLIFLWNHLRLTLGPARAAEESGRPVVYAFDDEQIANFVPAKPGVRPRPLANWFIERWAFPEVTLRGLRFEHTTCVSDCLERNLRKKGVPLDNNRVIHPGIPIEQFPIKEGAGRVPPSPRILYAGQLHPFKSVHTVIEGAHRLALKRDMCSPSVTIVGAGGRQYEKRLANLAGSGPAHVEFRGKVDHGDMPAIYREHDVFVFPSSWEEPFALTNLESMASGTPVVSTNQGGHGECLRDGENSLVFPKEDGQALAARLNRLIADHTLGPHLASEARKIVEREFALDRYVRDIEAFLKEAIEADRE